MKLKRLIPFLAGALVVGAIYMFGQQTSPARVAAPSGPKISDARRLAYYKALSEFQQAQHNLEVALQNAQQKRIPLDAAAADMAKECGDAYQLQISPDDVACVEKPKEAKK